MTTVRFIVSPGTRFVTFTRSPAFGLLLLIEIVAEFAVFVGFVLVAVKLALVLSAVAVRPIRTSPASAMPARRLSLRICVVRFSCPLRRLFSCVLRPGRAGFSVGATFACAARRSIGRQREDAAPLVVVPGQTTLRSHPVVGAPWSGGIRAARPRGLERGYLGVRDF